MGSSLKPAVFLDRDGTINVEKDYLYRIEDFEYMPGVVEGLKKLCGMGLLLVVITNQSGIARGFYTEADCRKLNEWMLEDLGKKGIGICGIYYCPHHPDGIVPEYSMECNCRKPNTGLFRKAQRELGIDLDRSFAIGDRQRDLAICREAEVRGLLLGGDNRKLAENRIRGCSDFGEAVRRIELWMRTPQDL